MIDVNAAAGEIASFLKARNWPYCLIGGLAVPAWGEARLTRDVDLCLFTGLGDEVKFITPLVERFQARSSSAAAFAEVNRVLLLQADNGIGIDISLGWTDVEQQMVERATFYQLDEGLVLPIATAEDLVVTKAFAGRPLDWVDVRRILARQRGNLDWMYIIRNLSHLCEAIDSTENLVELERLRDEIDAE